MEKYIVFIFAAYFIISIVSINKWIEYSKVRKLKENVSWCVVSHDMPLWIYLSNTQIEYDIPIQYRIDSDAEWDFVRKILDEYVFDLTKSFFRGELKLFNDIRTMNGESYFMLSLNSFLSEHECDFSFLNQDMHEKRISYKEYGRWGGVLFDATYSITDFSVAYHKMLYISYLFCKNSKYLNPDGDKYYNEKYIEEILDKKQIQISRL